MCKIRTCLASGVLTFGMAASTSFGQTSGVMNFDGGGDGSSWNQANNWEHVAEPDGTPTSGNPPTPPTSGYTANIGQLGVVLDNAMGSQATFRTRVGVTTPGSFNMTGGSMEVTDDVTLGQSAMGTMTMSGGVLTLGDDFFIDQLGAFGSSLTISGGRINIIDRLMMENQGHLQMNGGEIIAEDDFYVLGTSTVTLTGGLMSTIDKLNMGNATPAGPARLKIDGGIVRSNEWTDNPDLNFDDPTRFMSIIEINGSGKMQVEQATMPLVEAQGLISSGRFTTAGAMPLTATSVVVPEFFGRMDVVFTQISVVPEPASWLLVAVCGIAVGLRKRGMHLVRARRS